MNELWTKPERFNIDSGDELLTFPREVPLPAVLLVSLTSAGCSDIGGGLACLVLSFALLIFLAMGSGKNKPPRAGQSNHPGSGAFVAGGEGYVGGGGYGGEVGGGDCGGEAGGGGDGGGGGGDGGC
jgi:hypothetical protein